MKYRYFSDRVSLAMEQEKCVGCGICTQVCPHGVFDIREKVALIIDRDSCMECGACAKNCHFGAISVNSGVGCAVAIINGMLTGTEPSCDCSGGSDNCC
jgi:NAD-dependent dihydropyrimidine dehydrogenase PreA subunit